jgi:hypothetical protein
MSSRPGPEALSSEIAGSKPAGPEATFPETSCPERTCPETEGEETDDEEEGEEIDEEDEENGDEEIGPEATRSATSDPAVKTTKKAPSQPRFKRPSGDRSAVLRENRPQAKIVRPPHSR